MLISNNQSCFRKNNWQTI